MKDHLLTLAVQYWKNFVNWKTWDSTEYTILKKSNVLLDLLKKKMKRTWNIHLLVIFGFVFVFLSGGERLRIENGFLIHFCLVMTPGIWSMEGKEWHRGPEELPSPDLARGGFSLYLSGTLWEDSGSTTTQWFLTVVLASFQPRRMQVLEERLKQVVLFCISTNYIYIQPSILTLLSAPYVIYYHCPVSPLLSNGFTNHAMHVELPVYSACHMTALPVNHSRDRSALWSLQPDWMQAILHFRSLRLQLSSSLSLKPLNKTL